MSPKKTITTVVLLGIRRLSLASVPGLTDHGLRQAFHFMELVWLDLSHCTQVGSLTCRTACR